MKKILFTLVVLMALILIGMPTLNAQSFPHFIYQWSDPPQDCECSMVGTAYWRVDAALINECGEDFYTEWEGYDIVSESSGQVEFYPDWSCDDPSNEPCYLVTGIIRKLCPDGHGGFIVQCTGKFNELKSCYSLMHTNITLVVEWD
jgi:hypothetical protein